MTKALGFLTGVCLTVASLVLLLDRWEQQAVVEQLAVMSAGEEIDITTAAPPETDVTNVATDKGPVQPPATIDLPSPAEEVPTDTAPVTAGPAIPESGPAETEPDRQDQPANALPPGVADADVKAVSTGEVAPAAVAQADKDTVETLQTQHTAAMTVPATSGADDTRTHLFWSPFRSQWAAEGFARRLTNSTQIPIEVINAGAGKYRVAFAYQDESERLAHIERIESITGLQLE